MIRIALATAALALAAGCGGVPQTHYYQLHVDGNQPTEPASDVVMVIETFSTDAAYSDDRIVYRRSPYRLDYYHYHRWSAPPGELIADALRDAYRRTGRFRAVSGELMDEATVILSGRVLAIEEVDVTRDDWRARVALQLRLRDAETGSVIWSRIVREEMPVAEQSPVGVARALSAAVQRIAAETSGSIVAAAARQSPALSMGSPRFL